MSTLTDTIYVKQGDTFSVKLQGRPSGGHMWMYDETPQQSHLVQKLGEHCDPLPGYTGCIQEFKFDATGTGTTRLNFQYKRSWEPTALKNQVYNVHIGKDAKVLTDM